MGGGSSGRTRDKEKKDAFYSDMTVGLRNRLMLKNVASWHFFKSAWNKLTEGNRRANLELLLSLDYGRMTREAEVGRSLG